MGFTILPICSAGLIRIIGLSAQVQPIRRCLPVGYGWGHLPRGRRWREAPPCHGSQPFHACAYTIGLLRRGLRLFQRQILYVEYGPVRQIKSSSVMEGLSLGAYDVSAPGGSRQLQPAHSGVHCDDDAGGGPSGQVLRSGGNPVESKQIFNTLHQGVSLAKHPRLFW